MEESESKQCSIRGRSVRGKSFLIEEDVALCKSWLMVIQKTGHQQGHSIFWKQVMEQYKSNINSTNSRTAISLQSRWQTMIVSMKKLHGFLQQIELRHGSGMLEADKIVQAKGIYYEVEKKNFIFDHIWAILKDNMNFQEYLSNKKRKTDMFSPSTPPTSSPSTPSASLSLDSNIDPDNIATVDLGKNVAPEDLGKRALGSKTENENPRKNKKFESILETVTANSKMMLDLLHNFNKSQAEKEERKAEARASKLNILEMMNMREQRREEDEIMFKDTSNMSRTQKIYYDHRRAEIIARIEARKDVDLTSS